MSAVLKTVSAIKLFHGAHKLSRFQRTLSKTTKAKETVDVLFVKRPDMKEYKVSGKEGDSLLDVLNNHDIEFAGFGACEGVLSCSTCHVIFSEEAFDQLLDVPTDEELDMLDLAFGVTNTSRLCCQVFLDKEISGIRVVVPEAVNDQR